MNGVPAEMNTTFKETLNLINAISPLSHYDAIYYTVTLCGKCFPLALYRILGKEACLDTNFSEFCH